MRALAAQFRVLSILQSHVLKDQEPRFCAPVPIESFGEAGWSYTVETAVPGQPLSELIFLRSRGGRLDFLQNELSQCVEIVAKVPHVLKGSAATPEIDPDWTKIPGGVSLASGIEQTLAVEASRWSHEGLCAHGDCTIENVFWESGIKKASIIDWEHPIRGVPPLYDAFVLLLSSLPALALEYREIPSADDRLERQFAAAFFSTGPWAMATHQVLQHVCGNSPGAASDLWRQLLLSLVIRANYFLWRQPSLGRQYSRLLKFAAEHESLFVGRLVNTVGAQ
jgi:hypothetical protein